jgi:hypothetical protein
MASSFTSNTGIEKPATGEQSGTWGATANTNFDIIDRALNGVGTITLSGTTHTLTTSDGALSDGGYRVLILSGSPSGTNTITVSPNDAAKFFVVHNSSGETAIFTQGSGGNVTINNGSKKIIYCNGAGSGAAVVDVTASIELNAPILQGTSASAGKIIFQEDTDNGANTATLIGPASTADVTLTLPSTTGTVALTSDITDSFPPGTVQLFRQTSAPTGWTKDTTHNDKALRVVSGSAGTGGSVAFSTAFGTPPLGGTVNFTGNLAAGNLAVALSGDIGSTTLTTSQIAAHTHRFGIATNNSTIQQVGTAQRVSGSVNQDVNSLPTSSTGGGGSHNHTTGNLAGTVSGAPGLGNLATSLSSANTSIDVNYVDVIFATKN